MDEFINIRWPSGVTSSQRRDIEGQLQEQVENYVRHNEQRGGDRVDNQNSTQNPILLNVGSQLFRQHSTIALIKGNPFNDATIHAYRRRRTRSGVQVPSVVHVNTSVASAAVPRMSRIFEDDVLKHDGYNDDSDLDDEDFHAHEPPNVAPGSGEGASVVHSPELEDMSSSIETVSTITAFSDLALDSDITPAETSTAPSPRVQMGAAKTWEALIYWVYQQEIAWTQLRSRASPDSSRASTVLNSSVECSPKSMYRLADSLEAEEVKKLALQELRSQLDASNIVQEIFSDFTWRYPEVLAVEIDIFDANKRSESVQRKLKTYMYRVAAGEFPRSGAVLNALHARILPAAVDWL